MKPLFLPFFFLLLCSCFCSCNGQDAEEPDLADIAEDSLQDQTDDQPGSDPGGDPSLDDQDLAGDLADVPDDAADGSDQEPAVCLETAAGTFPENVQELAYDNGVGSYTIRTAYRSWTYQGSGRTYDLLAEPNWEAVRFDLEAPTTVYGARVQWADLPAAEAPIRLGGYPDFGSNGFDFMSWAPLFEGTRCLSDQDEAEWVDYVFDPPIEVDLPGLFYVGHFEADDSDPVFLFDNDTLGEGECALYDECHSALNFPQVDSTLFYRGLSTSFPYDYLVRLVVVIHDDIPPEERWFRQVTEPAATSRIAFGDYDGDGDDDLMNAGPRLLQNQGDGTFVDVTTNAGLDQVANSTSGGVWGDYDNDGCLDYFGFSGSYVSGEALLKNRCDGTFEDVTAASGIHDLQTDVDCRPDEVEHSSTEAAVWIDLDADGLLDLYLANGICWDLEHYYRDRIWHNQGDGTFVSWDQDHGFSPNRFAGRGASPIDADRDGDVDLLVSNYRLHPNFYFENQGAGQFVERARALNLAGQLILFQLHPYYGHTIGSAWLDLDLDGDWDIIEANLAHPRFYHFSDRTMLLINDGTGHFVDHCEAAGLHYRETHSNPTVLDFDLDGYPDLFVTAVYDGRFSELYRNNGDSTFTQVNYPAGAVIHNGWGSATSDLDNDGDPDLVAYHLFVNETASGDHHWLQVRALGGITANYAGIGAQVEVEAGGLTRLGHVNGGTGTGCQDSLFLVFGLGDNTQVDEVRVTYPGGSSVTVAGPIAADQRLWIWEDGTVGTGWAPPR
ncbi:MAG: CRTAC1 family protein [Bradymonadales bacterium]|nr:CRTAC1 family protein [Bradymonadales bacterium]